MIELSSRKKEAAKIIKKYLNNRELVVWGKRDVEFESYLEEMYGIVVAFHVFWDKKFLDGVKNRSITCLANKNNQYYVVNLELASIEKNTKFFVDHGYKEIKDFLFLGVVSKTVAKGAINYHDANENKCSYCPPLCTINFKGKNSEVIIDESVTIKGDLRITLADDCRLHIEKNCILGGGTILFAGDSSFYKMEENSAYNGVNVVLYSNSSLEIGAHTSIVGMMTRVCPYNKVIIGEDCMFSQDIIIFCGDGHAIYNCETKKRSNHPGINSDKKHSVVLGSHVWIGIRAVLLSGTDIGIGSIVGAGAVVKGTFPNNCAIAGNPAHMVKKDVAWSRDYLDIDIKMCGKANFEMTKIDL